MEHLDAGVRGWIVNEAKRNFWRVAGWYELEDLIQDGYYCYAKCRAKYMTEDGLRKRKSHPSDNDRRHFMALLKVAFTNHIRTLARKRPPEVAEAALMSVGQPGSIIEDRAGSVPADATGIIALASASPEIKQLISLLLDDKCPKYNRPVREGYRRCLRETTSEYYRRLLGLDTTGPDIRQEVLDLLTT